VRNGTVLALTYVPRFGIRALAPGAKQEREMGWFGLGVLTDISRDGRKVLFFDVSDAGGPNYTVLLRDSDGSPPANLGEGMGMALSPDAKWVITKPPKGGPLSLVPTGAGESKVLTHDSRNYDSVTWLPDGKRLLASGIEAGHGERDYLIDVSTGDSRPITPEGVAGVILSPDGKNAAVLGPDGNFGVWPLDGGGIRLIPGLTSKYLVTGWFPDGKSLYAIFRSDTGGIQGRPRKAAEVYKVDVATGKVEFWKSFGDPTADYTFVNPPMFSADGSAYAYRYGHMTSQAYVVTGLK
jgi:eukaryotic-like serine/threonine-protein kinase